jgi:hypothetical protein
VRKWAEVDAAEEAFTRLVEGCRVGDDNEALHKGFQEGSLFNEIQRRTSAHFSRMTNIPNPGNSARMRYLLGTLSQMSGYDIYAEWEWGSYSLVSLFRLISWQWY